MSVTPVLEIVPLVSLRSFALFVMLILGFSILLASLPVLMGTGWKMELFALCVIPNVLSARILQQIVQHVLCQEWISAIFTTQLACPHVPTQLSLQTLPTFALTAILSAWSALGLWIVSAVCVPRQVPIRLFSSTIPLVLTHVLTGLWPILPPIYVIRVPLIA